MRNSIILGQICISQLTKQKLPMRLCNSPDIFQEKMNELFNGLECIIAYINNLLNISDCNLEDLHIKGKII